VRVCGFGAVDDLGRGGGGGNGAAGADGKGGAASKLGIQQATNINGG